MITITHKGGVGVNSWYGIYRDGVGVGVIERNGMTQCMIRSNHYSEKLGFYRNVAAAKLAAETMYFPTEREVYETICGRVETDRRAWKERNLRHELMQAVYDLAKGSNSAQSRLIELAAEIDAFATDRRVTYEFNQKILEARRAETSERIYSTGEPLYPDPPQEEACQQLSTSSSSR